MLGNESAAYKLIHDVEIAILKRLEHPLAFEPVRSAKERDSNYYRIYVGSYTVFYVVIENTMEVRRLIYSPRNVSNLI